MNIINAFRIAFKQKREKDWDYIYVAIDVHGTIFKPTYSKKEKFEYYPLAKETLQMLCRRRGIKLILWSSSHPEMLEKYVKQLKKDKIDIAYVNENPEVSDTEIASFKQKFYFNVGIDNNFGFEPEEDWKTIRGLCLSLAVAR